MCAGRTGSHAGARPKINAPGCRAQQHALARHAAGIVSTRQQRLRSAHTVDIRLNDIYDWSVFTVQHASHYGAGSRGQRGYLPLVKSPYERGNKSSRSQVIVRLTDSSVGRYQHPKNRCYNIWVFGQRCRRGDWRAGRAKATAGLNHSC